MAHALSFEIDNGDSVSASVDMKHRDFVGFRNPSLTAGTAYIGFQTTESAQSVADASATWDDVNDQAGNRILVAMGTTASRVTFEPDQFLTPGRVRCECLQADGATPQAQGAAMSIVIKPRDFS